MTDEERAAKTRWVDFDVSWLSCARYADEGRVYLCQTRVGPNAYGWVPVLCTKAAGDHARIWNGRRSIDRWERVRNLLAWDDRIGPEDRYAASLMRAREAGGK